MCPRRAHTCEDAFFRIFKFVYILFFRIDFGEEMRGGICHRSPDAVYASNFRHAVSTKQSLPEVKPVGVGSVKRVPLGVHMRLCEVLPIDRAAISHLPPSSLHRTLRLIFLVYIGSTFFHVFKLYIRIYIR